MVDGFRERVRRGERLLGVFLKTASHQTVELLGLTGLDFAIIDAEHAPFDPSELDRMALAARAADLPLLIRPPEPQGSFISQALDLGLSGVVAPHVDGSEAAQRLLEAVRYDRGRRGVSPSTRAAGYGAPDLAAYLSAADARTSVWCQIEDAAALDRLDEIAAIDELDCLFIGRVDLAVSLGVQGPSHPKVDAAVAVIAEAGRRAGRAVGMFLPSLGEAERWAEQGVSVFVCGSDQSWLLSQGRALAARFERLRRG